MAFPGVFLFGSFFPVFFCFLFCLVPGLTWFHWCFPVVVLAFLYVERLLGREWQILDMNPNEPWGDKASRPPLRGDLPFEARSGRRPITIFAQAAQALEIIPGSEAFETAIARRRRQSIMPRRPCTFSSAYRPCDSWNTTFPAWGFWDSLLVLDYGTNKTHPIWPSHWLWMWEPWKDLNAWGENKRTAVNPQEGKTLTLCRSQQKQTCLILSDVCLVSSCAEVFYNQLGSYHPRI